MKDVVHREIQVGDKVAYCVPHYSGLRVGYVIKLTPRGANVGSRREAISGLWRGSDQICLLEKAECVTS